MVVCDLQAVSKCISYIQGTIVGLQDAYPHIKSQHKGPLPFLVHSQLLLDI